MTAPVVLGETRGVCPRCGVEHPARYLADKGAVCWRFDCPAGAREEPVSGDAALWAHLRAQDRPLATGGYRRVHIVEITGRCDRRCPICYTAAGEEGEEHRDAQEVLAWAREIRADGAKGITLSGGEATLHPGILDLVRGCRRLGLRVQLATNGRRLAAEPGLAVALRRAGLGLAHLQCDGFRAATLRAHRGHDEVGVAPRAAAACRRAGLPFTLLATVSGVNLDETATLVDHALAWGSCCRRLVFQRATPAGRFGVATEALPTREDVVRAAWQSAALQGVPRRCLHPLPSFAPWRLSPHPDCAAMILLARRGGRWGVLDQDLDLERFARLLAADHHGTAWWWRNPLPAWYLLCSIRPGRAAAVFGVLGDFLRRRRQRLLPIVFESFCTPNLQDVERLARCPVDLHGRRGERGCPCTYAPDRRVPRRPS